MKELEYPFDAGYILSKKRRIKRELLESDKPFIEKNVAILGGSTTSEIKNILELFLLNNGIKPYFYESEYSQYYEEAVFTNKKLKEFQPDVIYIHTTNRNIVTFPSVTDDSDSVDILLNNEMEKYKAIWSNISSDYQCPIIQNNFEMPEYRLLGNKDASDIHGAVNYITRLNMKFYEYAQTHENFFICDINYISADYGLKEWSDSSFYHLYKYALNVNAIPYLALNIANIIKSIFGKNKKGFVLDLDNTLWGGIIGDDGPENIRLGPEEPEGRVFLEFQRYIKEHKKLGIVLSIDSKNDYENALAGLNHPNSELCVDDFVSIKANWNPKDKNFMNIADGINLLPESLVFIDDNPAERYIVTEHLYGVIAPDIGESHQYIHNIDRNGFFEITTLSTEDLKRSEMYKENAKRLEFQSGFADYGEYLQSLNMKSVIKPFEPVYLTRILQLINKSNQFNVTTKRFTQSNIEFIALDENYIDLSGKLIDCFGDNGIVSVLIGHVIGKSCHIDLWVMSCRVLKRDMEYAMMDTLVCECQKRELTDIKGYFYPTEKNGIVRELYEMLGFEKIVEDEMGNTEWIYKIDTSYTKKNKYITVEELT